MKNLTVIEGQNEKFILISQETDSYGLKAYYVSLTNYNDGFFNDKDIIPIEVQFVYQKSDNIVGWLANDYDQPDYSNQYVYPGDDDFDYKLAAEIALEVANELILQNEINNNEYV